MTSRIMRIAVPAAALFLSATFAMFAQEVVEKKTFEGVIGYQIRDMTSIETMTLFVKHGRLRLEGTEQSGGNAILTDYSLKKCFIIISGREQYAELPIIYVPPKGEAAAQRLNVQKTDSVDTIEEYDCDQFLVTLDSLEFEIWATKGFNTAGSFLSAQVADWMWKILDMGYFPMRFIVRDQSGDEIQRFEVNSVTKKSLNEYLFRIPSGYEKIDPDVLQPKQAPKKKKR